MSIVWLFTIVLITSNNNQGVVESLTWKSDCCSCCVPKPQTLLSNRPNSRFYETNVHKKRANNNNNFINSQINTRNPCLNHLQSVVQLSLSSDDSSSSSQKTEKEEEEEEGKGSLIGASLLFAGTAIGAGMLALPAETAQAGFVPSISGLVFCWVFTYVTSLLTLEATWRTVLAQQQQQQQQQAQQPGRTDSGTSFVSPHHRSVGFLSVSRRALGPWGERITALLFGFLLSAIVVAYTSEGGQLLSQAVRDVMTMTGNISSSNVSEVASLSPVLGSILFMLFFGSLAVFGTERVDLINRVLVAGFLIAFVGLVGVGLPSIQPTALISSSRNWNAVYPGATSVGILAFGAQNVVPTLLEYLGGDAERTRRSIFAGSLLPLVMYVVWETVFFGLVPLTTSADVAASAATSSSNTETIDIVKELGYYGGPAVQALVKLFSVCAVGSSMAGASVSLVDFLEDALSSFSDSSSDTTTTAISTESDSITKATTTTITGLRQRFIAALLALGLPLGFACAYPRAFLGALESAGLIGGVSLYGIVPALAVLRLRSFDAVDDNGSLVVDAETSPVGDFRSMPGKLPGGSLALYGIVVLSTALVLPDLFLLSESYLSNLFP